MDRKGIIAVTIAVAALIVWNIHYSREMEKYQRAKAAAEATAKASAPPVETPSPIADNASPVAPSANPVVPATPSAPGAEETIEKLGSPVAEFSFTNLGGGIARAVLLEHAAENSERVTLNTFGHTPIGAVTERAGEEATAPFTSSVNPAAGEITYERTDARQLKTTKKFTVPRAGDPVGGYVVHLDVTFANGGAEPIPLSGYAIHLGSAGPVHRLDQPLYTGFDYYREGKNTAKGVTTFGSGGVLGFGRTDQPVFAQPLDNVGWAGVTNQYFATIVTPTGKLGNAVWAHKFLTGDAGPLAEPTGRNRPAVATTLGQMPAVEGALGMPGFTLAAGESASQHFEIYTGPREFHRLAALGGGQEAIMDFGMFKAVSKVLLNSMNWLRGKLGSYAAAIIVLTLIIRGLMWPLQNKATQSMKKMQALQPKMNELKAKYPDDPQKMNAELMKLYKDYQINPVAGCLPMVVQIPVFFGFYNMLGKAVELRNSHFLWVNDLSQPDTVAMIPGLHFPVNVLPLCMAVTMFFQMYLSPKSGDPVQQRVFMFMPLIFIFFCYNFASALALYWTVQNLFSIGQLYVTRNQATPVLQKISQRPKK